MALNFDILFWHRLPRLFFLSWTWHIFSTPKKNFNILMYVWSSRKCFIVILDIIRCVIRTQKYDSWISFTQDLWAVLLDLYGTTLSWKYTFVVYFLYPEIYLSAIKQYMVHGNRVGKEAILITRPIFITISERNKRIKVITWKRKFFYIK